MLVLATPLGQRLVPFLETVLCMCCLTRGCMWILEIIGSEVRCSPDQGQWGGENQITLYMLCEGTLLFIQNNGFPMG
jgi:hypothetical protein